jgi:germacradienol/geosmin synthase
MESVELPDFYLPFPARLNPLLDTARPHAKAWARRMGMLGSIEAWSHRQFDAADFALFAALTHPDAEAEELLLVNDWHLWRWYADDYFAEVFKHSRDLVGARTFVERLGAFMPIKGQPTLPPANPAERALADVWMRTTVAVSVDLRQRLRGQVERFLESWLWELANLAQNRVPDPVDYVEMRRRTGGAELSAGLARFAMGTQLPPELYATRPMRELVDTFSDIGPLRNDIFSYQKEIENEGEINNGVHVVRQFLGCDLREAVDVVNELVTARVQQFEKTVTNELPVLLDQYKLSTRARQQLRAYVEGLQDWLAGDLRWATVTGRYRRPSSPTTLTSTIRKSGRTDRPHPAAAYPPAGPDNRNVPVDTGS